MVGFSASKVALGNDLEMGRFSSKGVPQRVWEGGMGGSGLRGLEGVSSLGIERFPAGRPVFGEGCVAGVFRGSKRNETGCDFCECVPSEFRRGGGVGSAASEAFPCGGGRGVGGDESMASGFA
jgi:hypothetical protein